VGAFLGVLMLSAFDRYAAFQGIPTELVIGSFGATGVLLYAAPNADFSMPRNLFGGHLISAIIGVGVYKSIGGDHVLAAPLSVSFAIVGMKLTNTLHPPGGATALIAVTGGQHIHNLGLSYAIHPVLSGVLVMFLIQRITIKGRSEGNPS
jgi:CBS-domain-containing membrane protein